MSTAAMGLLNNVRTAALYLVAAYTNIATTFPDVANAEAASLNFDITSSFAFFL
jgi:hypothetical protein